MSLVTATALREVEALPYADTPTNLRQSIARLQTRAYGLSDSSPEDADTPLHLPTLNAQSFFIRDHARVLSYAAVVSMSIRHADQTFSLAGLACVATDP